MRWVAAAACVAALLVLPAVSGGASRRASYVEVGHPAAGGGITLIQPGLAAGSGRFLYAVTGSRRMGEEVWSSADAGVTWTRTVRPAGDDLETVIVSRDDPRTAYVHFSNSAVGDAALRMRDGGQSWTVLTGEHVASISRLLLVTLCM